MLEGDARRAWPTARSTAHARDSAYSSPNVLGKCLAPGIGVTLEAVAHSVELLLDDASDQRIRDDWQRLRDAGLPSQIDNRSPTNRPHITLIAAERIDPLIDAALAPVSMRLPFSAIIGAPIVFGTGPRRTLARLVVPSTELLSVHAQVVRLGAGHTATNGTSSVFDHCRPGAWTPHVTLARRLGPEQIGEALAVLDDNAVDHAAPLPVTVSGLRRWDGDAKSDHVLAGRAC